jgi:molybdopterin molybdotransferase
MNAIVRPVGGCGIGGLSFDTAFARILALTLAPLAAERVALPESPGRVLAAAVPARLDLPRFDQAAMDGYAVRCADLTPGGLLPITGRTAAGEVPGHLAEGGVHRILTGAPMPEGADAVIVQEDVLPSQERIRLMAPVLPGSNIRRRGEDMRAGQILATAGTRLDWRHVAIFAAHGIADLAVRRAPRVAVLSSGRELRGPGEALQAGQIHDSNGPMLAALLRAWGARIIPTARVDDTPAAMRAALAAAASSADLVLSSAGISVGDEDHVRDALHDLGGDLAVLSVAMKPGKPLAAGRLGQAVFIGLPGNPLAALAGAVAFVRPLLAAMLGCAPATPMLALAGFGLHRKPGRTEFLPVRLCQRGTRLWAERTGPDGSGRLSPLLTATGLAMLGPDIETLEHGAMLKILPFWPAMPD